MVMRCVFASTQPAILASIISLPEVLFVGTELLREMLQISGSTSSHVGCDTTVKLFIAPLVNSKVAESPGMYEFSFTVEILTAGLDFLTVIVRIWVVPLLSDVLQGYSCSSAYTVIDDLYVLLRSFALAGSDS